MEPDGGTAGANVSHTGNLEAISLVGDGLGDRGSLLEEVVALDAVVDKSEEADIVLKAAEGSALKLAEVASGLHPLTERDVVRLGGGLVLPERAGSTAASGGFIDHEGGFKVVADGAESCHKLIRGHVAGALLSGLDDNGGHRATRAVLFLQGGANMLEDLALVLS